jgi:hypothetical protein
LEQVCHQHDSSPVHDSTNITAKPFIKTALGPSPNNTPSSMEIPLALLWTSKLLYPSFFEDIDILEEMRWFYEEFFGLQLSDDKLAQIISGKGMRDPKS